MIKKFKLIFLAGLILMITACSPAVQDDGLLKAVVGDEVVTLVIYLGTCPVCVDFEKDVTSMDKYANDENFFNVSYPEYEKTYQRKLVELLDDPEDILNNITSVPTVLIIKDSEVVRFNEGYMNENELDNIRSFEN